MSDQNENSLRKAKDVREMAAEVSRLRSVVNQLLREKQELKEALLVTSELRDMVVRLQERERQFKDALHDTVGAIKIAIGGLEELIEQDVEITPATETKELPLQAGKEDSSVLPPPPGICVVEEGHFRWRPMRLLSDGTIEVDTPAGRLRFVDQFHVEEYFDAHWPLPTK